MLITIQNLINELLFFAWDLINELNMELLSFCCESDIGRLQIFAQLWRSRCIMCLGMDESIPISMRLRLLAINPTLSCSHKPFFYSDSIRITIDPKKMDTFSYYDEKASVINRESDCVMTYCSISTL